MFARTSPRLLKPRLTVFVCTVVLVGWFFGPALIGTGNFAFRDAAHYYQPLAEYVRQQWSAGSVPLWNPQENLGVPLAAQNTSSVFYPGQLLLALPLQGARPFHLYVVLHVVLAAATSYLLARYYLQAGRLAASLAAVSYALGGNVLFLYANVVFLVGAAWLPLAVLLADRMLRRRCVRSAIGLGVVLALMILGGDPQMAYNAVLLAALDAILLWRDDRRNSATAAETKTSLGQRRAMLVGLALVVAGLLAAVQILPTLEAAPHSRRARYDAPRNVFELAWSLTTDRQDAGQLAWYDALLGRTSGGHERQIYQFSVAPWRGVELVWPNVTGRAFPTNGRWLGPLGVESSPWDLWTPTLYMGLLPLVLAAAAWSLRPGAPVEIRWLSWMVVLGAVASLGVYGLAWAVGLASGGEPGEVGGQVGGLYWLLTVLLPKYVYFRYPAKWFVVASLGLSMLAARGWDEAWPTGGLRLRRAFVALAVLSLIGLGATVLGWSLVERFAGETPPTPILGPFDWAAARWDVASAFAQTAVLALLLLAAFRWSRAKPRWAQAISVAVLAATALELAIAQRLLVMYAPSDDWQSRPGVLDKLPDGLAGYRVFRQHGTEAPSWATSFSPRRLAECVRWDRQTLYPKYPLPYGVSLVEASETLESDDYRAVLGAAREYNARQQQGPLPAASVLDLLAAKVAIVGPDGRGQLASGEPIAEGMFIGLRPDALARAWIVHQIEVMEEFTSRSPTRLQAFTREVLFPDGQPRNWREVAVVETAEPIAPEPQPRDASSGEHCTIVRADPLLVEIEAKLASAGLVVLADLYYPGWELTVETEGQAQRAPILRTNRVMRGVALPAGTHRLTYRYRPKSVLYGGAISGASVVLLAAAAIVAARRRRRGRGTAGP